MNESPASRRGELEFVRLLRQVLALPHQPATGLDRPAPSIPFGDDMCLLESPGGPLLWTAALIS